MDSENRSIDEDIARALAKFPLVLAILFGSVAKGTARPDSDLDIGVSMGRPLEMNEKMEMIEALAELTGRPVDLVDLYPAPEPLLGEVLRHGRRILGGDAEFAKLITRHLIEEADFMPYKRRILAERRAAWIGE